MYISRLGLALLAVYGIVIGSAVVYAAQCHEMLCGLTGLLIPAFPWSLLAIRFDSQLVLILGYIINGYLIYTFGALLDYASRPEPVDEAADSVDMPEPVDEAADSVNMTTSLGPAIATVRGMRALLLESPGDTTRVLRALQPWDHVQVLAWREDGWVQIRYGYQEGYVAAAQLTTEGR